MGKSRRFYSLFAAVLAGVSLAGCAQTSPGAPESATRPAAGAKTADLMANITPGAVKTASADDKFTQAMAGFSVDLFKQVADGKKNCLVSPLSAELALAMAANGACGQTLSQMEKVLGGGMAVDKLNAVLPAFVKNLPSTDKAKFHFADSIWCNSAKGVNIKKDFLQANADYYGAGLFSAPFSGQTVKDINAWVKEHTDGMIPSLVDSLDPGKEAAVLLNALAFDAEWAVPYMDNQVQSGQFTSAAGKKQTVDFMGSGESTYLDDGKATGFTKSYANDTYRFVALLPNQGVSMEDYLKSLTGAKLMDTLQNAQSRSVNASLPKFSFSYSATLNNALKAMGMQAAFSPSAADFSKMGTMDGAPLYIDQVLQKTFIDVTPMGTRAGAATAVMMAAGAAMSPKTVKLDRPFVFAIVDGATNLPLFLGVVNSVGE